jgi:IS5 family transposase
MKSEGHLGRNYLKGRHGDHANAMLTAAGYNFRLVLTWLRLLLRLIMAALLRELSRTQPRNRLLNGQLLIP